MNTSVAWDSLVLSLEIATFATLITTLVGVGLATLLASPRMPARNLIDAIVCAPLVLPPTVLGYYLVVLLGVDSSLGRAWHWLTGGTIVFSFSGAVIAATLGSLPLVVRAARPAIEAIDPNLRDAARTLGASRMRVLFTITLPLAAPGIIGGAMLGFARALGDFGATMMVIGSRVGNTKPLSIFIYDAFAANQQHAALANVLVASVVAIVLLYAANRVTRRRHAA